MTARKRICLFGTSANPPTGQGGHKGIVSHLASLKCSQGEYPLFDEVRVLPVYNHMFAAKRDKLASFEHRFNMCKLAFENKPNVVVSDQEKVCFEWVAAKRGIETEVDLGNLRVGTADLLDMLLEKDMSSDYTLALGADTFMDFTSWKWRRAKDIFRLVNGRIIVIQRKVAPKTSIESHVRDGQILEEDLVSEEFLLERIQSINAENFENLSGGGNIRLVKIPTLSTVSSSLVRSSPDEEYLSKHLSPEVLGYIIENKLYGFESKN